MDRREARNRMSKPKWLYPPEEGKTPYWTYDFRLDGDRFHGSTKCEKLPEARKFVERLRASIIAGTYQARRPEMTLDLAFGRFFVEIGQYLKEAKNLKSRFGQLLKGLGKDTLLSELGDGRLSTWQAQRRAGTLVPSKDPDEPPRLIRPGAATINRELETLRRVYRRAALWKVALGDQPSWKDLILPEPAQRKWTLGRKAVDQLIITLPDDLREMALFAYLSGARLSNVVRLRWADVDTDRGMIILRDMKSARDGELHEIPLTPELRAILATRNGQHETQVFTYLCTRASRPGVKPVRVVGERYPFTKDNWRRRWARTLKAVRLTDLHFHDLRHGAGTELLRATGNLRLVQQSLGHERIETTTRYATVDEADMRAGMEARFRNLSGSETGRLAGRPVSVVETTTYKGAEDDGQPVPKAGALPG